MRIKSIKVIDVKEIQLPKTFSIYINASGLKLERSIVSNDIQYKTYNL